MDGLEQAFYIIAIIFMSISLLLIISIVTAVIVIRNKVIALEKLIQAKLDAATRVPNKVVEIANAVKEVARAVK